MRTSCALCGSGQWPDACLAEDDATCEGGRVCVSCAGRATSLILEAPTALLEELWLVPRQDKSEQPIEQSALDLDAQAVYRDMGLLDDALYEAATAYEEINDPEVRREALVVVFGLLREGGLERLRALLYPV